MKQKIRKCLFISDLRLFFCDSVAIRTQDPRLRRTSPKKSLLDLFSDSYNDVHFQKKQAYSKRESNIVSIFPGLNEGQDSISLFFASR